MVASTADICAFGWKARDFALKGVDGKTYSLADVRGPNGTLIVFICNHCPYVKASVERIVGEARALREIGIGTIAIMPNDTEAYPEDSFDNMKRFSAQYGFTFTSLTPMALSAHPISSVSTPKMSCSIAVGLMHHAQSRSPTLVAIYTKQ